MRAQLHGVPTMDFLASVLRNGKSTSSVALTIVKIRLGSGS